MSATIEFDHLHPLEAPLGRWWPWVLRLIDLALPTNTPVLLVGGCVRDILLGRALKDVDLLVEGDAVALGHRAAAFFGGRCVEHGAFGTARWETLSGEVIDLATARTEVYDRPAALPRVSPSTVLLDLHRRDFSVNAMALRLLGSRGQLIDPLGGQQDLTRRQLRVLHPRSFHDDPTRALRAARFCARFHFHFDPASRCYLDEAHKDGIFAQLGLERLGHELDHLFREPTVQGAWQLLESWHLTALIDPALATPGSLGHRFEHAQTQSAPGDTDLSWLLLAEALPPAARSLLLRLVPGGRRQQGRWRAGPERVAAALQGIDHLSRADQAERLVLLDAVELRLAALHSAGRPAAAVLRWWEERGKGLHPAFAGDALLAAGIPAGPAIGDALRAARRAAWAGEGAAAQWSAALGGR